MAMVSRGSACCAPRRFDDGLLRDETFFTCISTVQLLVAPIGVGEIVRRCRSCMTVVGIGMAICGSYAVYLRSKHASFVFFMVLHVDVSAMAIVYMYKCAQRAGCTIYISIIKGKYVSRFSLRIRTRTRNLWRHLRQFPSPEPIAGIILYDLGTT